MSAITMNLSLSLPASAQDFYAGKTVTIFVGYAAGSGYDVNARFVARHISAQLPGKPTVIVQNMPGAGALNAANHLANTAAKDGTAMALVARGMGIEPMLGGKGVRFDPLKLHWIGSTSRETSVIVVRADMGVKRIEDVRNREVVVAGPSPGTDGVTYPNVLNNLLGTKFRIVMGYRSGKEMAMAVKRGEVQGRGSWSWASLKTEALEEVRNGEYVLLLQMALRKSPELPDLPLVMDFVTSAEQKQILEIILAGQEMAWPIFAPAEVPAERIALLRKAYADMLKTPEALSEAKKLGIDIDPVSGDDIAAMLRRLYSVSPEIVARVRKLAGRE